MVSDGGPWSPEEVMHLIDLDGDAPWQGGNEPAPLEAGSCPGGLTAVLYDADGHEAARWPMPHPASVAAAAEEGAEACIKHGSARLIIFDGDSGKPVLSLCSQAPPQQ